MTSDFNNQKRPRHRRETIQGPKLTAEPSSGQPDEILAHHKARCPLGGGPFYVLGGDSIGDLSVTT